MRNVPINTRTDSMVPASDQPEGPVWRTSSGGYTGDFDAAQQALLKQKQADAVAAGEGVIEYAGREAHALLTGRAEAEHAAWHSVLGAVPQGLSSRLLVARESLAEAQGRVGTARAQLARLLGNEGRPRTPADVEDWAHRKSELEASILGYTPYVEAAREECERISGDLLAWLIGELAQRVGAARVHTRQVEDWAAQVVAKTEQTAEDARIQQQAIEFALSELTTGGQGAIRFDLWPRPTTIDTTNEGGKK